MEWRERHGVVSNKIEVFQPEEIQFLLQKAQCEYTDRFRKQGYIIHPPEPVASRRDPTVHFVGSTITPLKPLFLQASIPTEGVCLVQPCIRTQNEKSLYDNSAFPEYNTFFHIVGGIAPVDQAARVAKDSVDYFVHGLGVDKSRLLIKLHSADTDLIHAVDTGNSEIPTVLDTHTDSYYRWKYGIPGVQGRGLTYAILQNDGLYKDIGNIIVMEGHGYTPAVQWGYGVETSLARIYSLPQPLAASLISSVIEYKGGLTAKYADTLAACLEMFRVQVLPDNVGRGRMLRNYLKGLSYLRRLLGTGVEQLTQQARAYVQYGNELHLTDLLVNYIQHHENRLQTCRSAIQKELSHRPPEMSQSLLDDSVLRNHLSDKYGIPIADMQLILDELLSSL